MPRTGRLVIPGYPHHVVQRGHDRQAVFSEPADYRLYLDNLREFKDELEVSVLAFCLMTNHVHLVLQPGDDPSALGKLMKRLAGRQTRHVNRRAGRRGTLWESRYKSSPIETDRYLLACCRYVELNPLRARMVSAPEDYAWSSVRQRLGLEPAWVDRDPSFEALARSPAERSRRYRRFLNEAVDPEERDMIRSAARRGQLTGSDAFIDRVERLVGRRVERRAPGRPRKRDGIKK